MIGRWKEGARGKIPSGQQSASARAVSDRTNRCRSWGNWSSSEHQRIGSGSMARGQWLGAIAQRRSNGTGKTKPGTRQPLESQKLGFWGFDRGFVNGRRALKRPVDGGLCFLPMPNRPSPNTLPEILRVTKPVLGIWRDRVPQRPDGTLFCGLGRRAD